MTEPESLVLQLLREMRAEMREARAEAATKSELADLRSEVHSLAANVASDMLSLEKRLSEQITFLRRSVMEYHSSAIGHGILFTEVEERVSRIEAHLNLPTRETH